MPTLVPLDNSVGAALIGLVLSTVIYGITWLQVYMYYTTYCSRDSNFLKSFVAVLMLLDTAHVSLLVICLYHYVISNFGDYLVLAKPTWSLIWQAFVGGILSIFVDSFFAMRAYHISGKRLIFPVIIGVLCLAKLACTIGFTVESLQLQTFTQGGSDLGWSTSALGSAVACDSVIAATLIYYLRKSRTGFTRTNRAVTLLITYALNTCLLTSMFNTIAIIFWVKSNTTLLYALFYFILIRLYSCSFMSTLNSRENVRKELNGTGNVITMSAFAVAEDHSSQTEGSRNMILDRQGKDYTNV